MINRPFLSSIAFRLPFAIAFICVLSFSLATIAVYGLQRAREEMAAYGLQAFSSLAKASLVSRQVSDLVSSAPFLMNAASPYRVSSESRAVVLQVDNLLQAMKPEGEGTGFQGSGSARIVELLDSIRTQTTALAGDAESAQQHKAEAAAALGEIATGGRYRRYRYPAQSQRFGSVSVEFRQPISARRTAPPLHRGNNTAAWTCAARHARIFKRTGTLRTYL